MVLEHNDLRRFVEGASIRVCPRQTNSRCRRVWQNRMFRNSTPQVHSRANLVTERLKWRGAAESITAERHDFSQNAGVATN
jgi:hypothetical protein